MDFQGCDYSPSDIFSGVNSYFNKEKSDFSWGMNVISSSAYGMSSIQMKKNINSMAKVGGTSVIFVPLAYQQNPSSNEIWIPNTAPTKDALKDIINFSKSLGLKVGVKPHLNMFNGEPRNRINPDNFTVWAQNYRRYIIDFAEFSQSNDVDLFFIGTELQGVSSKNDFWTQLVVDVRKLFKGRVTYSSNRLGEAKSISWWGELDAIAVSFYEPLMSSSKQLLDSDNVESSWYYRGYVSDLYDLHYKWRLPIVFGEIGYYGRSDTLIEPAIESKSSIDLGVQAMSYRIAYKVLSSMDVVDSYFIWALDASSKSEAGGYSVFPTNNTVICTLKEFNIDR
ncbi:glycoside hydrolase family 113 [Rheinheimera sp.]|uniref:glycoside hydrolase family 113 n=1 Tax=Rheinheimera sp. TaxID=1869214 RepID=UPI003AF6106E